jgi:hypothetical protein
LPQLWEGCWLQVPVPVQVDAGWYVVPVHDTARPQEVLDDPCWQPLAPSHLPVFPQGRAAAHWPAGAAVPAASAVHVPGIVPLQVWQVPQTAVPQQTPFTQLPLMHWLPAAHALPGGFSAQFLAAAVVPWHVNGARQSPSPVHGDVLQAPVPQTYGVQVDDVAAAQAPVPLQCEIGVNVDPEQVAVPQETVVAASWQPAAPLQKPVLPQGGLAAQRFIGSALPSGTFAQLPALAPTLHAVHSEHALLTQQTPSTQK